MSHQDEVQERREMNLYWATRDELRSNLAAAQSYGRDCCVLLDSQDRDLAGDYAAIAAHFAHCHLEGSTA